jgi:hypothetical protein
MTQLLHPLQPLSPTSANAAATFRVTRSSRRLQRSWRRLASHHKPTSQLAQDFAAQGVATLNQQQEQEDAAPEAEPEPEAAPTAGFVMIGGVGSIKTSSKHECFEDFAKKLQSPVTIKAAQVHWTGQAHATTCKHLPTPPTLFVSPLSLCEGCAAALKLSKLV